VTLPSLTRVGLPLVSIRGGPPVKAPFLVAGYWIILIDTRYWYLKYLQFMRPVRKPSLVMPKGKEFSKNCEPEQVSRPAYMSSGGHVTL
jgi:hypothetical protein